MFVIFISQHNNRSCEMDIIQFITIMIALLGGFGFMYKEFKSFEKDIRDDIKIQALRSDRLYEIVISLLEKKS